MKIPICHTMCFKINGNPPHRHPPQSFTLAPWIYESASYNKDTINLTKRDMLIRSAACSGAPPFGRVRFSSVIDTREEKENKDVAVCLVALILCMNMRRDLLLPHPPVRLQLDRAEDVNINVASTERGSEPNTHRRDLGDTYLWRRCKQPLFSSQNGNGNGNGDVPL